MSALAAMGPAARPAVPVLSRALREGFESSQAQWALQAIGPAEGKEAPGSGTERKTGCATVLVAILLLAIGLAVLVAN